MVGEVGVLVDLVSVVNVVMQSMQSVLSVLRILVVGFIDQISKNHLIKLIVFEDCIGESKFMMIFPLQCRWCQCSQYSG